jgi:hypothetical protein
MKASDISDKAVLEYLAQFQGEWTSLWNGHFKENPRSDGHIVNDVYYSMPVGTPPKVALAKMKRLYNRGFIGGCTCGCRGDFEITDKGLAFIGQKRIKRYSGY